MEKLKMKIGDHAIVTRLDGHQFFIGERIEILTVHEEGTFKGFYFASSIDRNHTSWWLNDEKCEHIKKCQWKDLIEIFNIKNISDSEKIKILKASYKDPELKNKFE